MTTDDNQNFLIVDDNQLLCCALKRVISEQKYVVKAVHTGSDAILEISGITYHSVLLEVDLPDMTGLDLLKKIRKISPNTKVIVTAGKNIDYFRKYAIDEGAFNFIAKPFGISDIRGIIQDIYN